MGYGLKIIIGYKLGKIEIQLTNQQMQKDKVKVTHRQGYFAKTATKK